MFVRTFSGSFLFDVSFTIFLCLCYKACQNLHIRDVFVINK